jgi:hypothetical protein
MYGNSLAAATTDYAEPEQRDLRSASGRDATLAAAIICLRALKPRFC